MQPEPEQIFSQPPHQVEEFTDPELGCRGWFVRDTVAYPLCAGGMRLQPGLTLEGLSRMARNMTLKMRISGLRVDGAKCGLDLHPDSPNREKAISRFMEHIRFHIENSYSMGPDLNVKMTELERIARSLGIPSVKMAVARAQGWELSYYLERASILDHQVDGWSISRLRAGYGVSAAVLAVLDSLQIHDQARVAIQGFGTIAKAAAHGLHRAGVSIIAVSDSEKSIIAPAGRKLDIENLIQATTPLLPRTGLGDAVVGANEDIMAVHCDVLIPAAVENTVTADNSSQLNVRAVVPGANLGVSREAEEELTGRGVLVLPDFLAGCGGSLSMEGLFAPREHPAPEEVLDHLHNKMKRLVAKVLARSKDEGTSPTVAALRYCEEAPAKSGTRPYGKDC